MAVSVSKAGPYYSSDQIKFSDLRRDFRAQQRKTTSGGSETFNTDTAAISASELLRDTDVTEQSPIVPDCTENAGISASNDWKVSQFRNSIKYYYMTLPSADTVTNFDIDAQSWNTNLDKNINKTFFLEGTCGSSSTSDPAVELDATVYNLNVIISGDVYGAGGAGGTAGANGGDGGDAVYIDTNGTGTVTIKTTASAEVYGGGGGGGGGGKGGKGGNAQYNTYYTFYTSIGGGSGTYGGSYDQRCRSACSSVGGEWANNCYKHTSEGGQNCGGNTSDYWSAVCYSDDASSYASTTACRKTNTGTNVNNSTGGAGGSAVDGGNGRGYLQSKSNGASYNTGSSGGTNAGTGGNSGIGGNGGDWGQGGTDYNGGNGVKGTDGTQGSASTIAAPDFGDTDGPVTGGLGGSAGASVAGSGYTIDTSGVDSAYKGPK